MGLRISARWYEINRTEKHNENNHTDLDVLAVAAAMISRTGMMWFLLSCFAHSNRRLRISIIICMIIQIAVNSITIVQIVVQCGPNPYQAVSVSSFYVSFLLDIDISSNYFIGWPNSVFPLHVGSSSLRWIGCMSITDGADNYRICTRRLVRNLHRKFFFSDFLLLGFNTVIDLYLGGLAAFELWQFFIQTLERNPGVPVWKQFNKINGSVRSRRIWQTLTLSGYEGHFLFLNCEADRCSRPLFLSGAASVVKTYVRWKSQFTMDKILTTTASKIFRRQSRFYL